MQNSTPPNTITQRSHHLRIALASSEVEERTDSICLTLRVTHEGAWWCLQRAGRRIRVKYTALDAFEPALRRGQEAVSMDVSDHPTLRIVPGGRRTHVPIDPAGTRRSPDGETPAVALAAEPSSPAGLAQAFRDIPRWR